MSTKKSQNVTGAVLVLGGGIAGISAAKNLAEGGYKVYLVEKSLTIGGHMAQLDKTYPTNDCSLCILAPKMVEVARDPNITLLTNSELIGLEGEPGNFRATVLQKPRYVEATKCKACGDCAAVCPVNGIRDEFNYGLGVRHAIHIPFPSAVPATYAIDPSVCLHMNHGICMDCAKACNAGAINYDQKPQELALRVGAIIVATGFDEIDPNMLAKTLDLQKISPNVMVGMEFERLMCASGPTGGHIVRRTDGHPAKRIAFVQCVGSRNTSDICAVPYCSRICCMYATKEAIITKEHGPDVECVIFNPESRAYEKKFQDYIERAKEQYGVKFVKGRIGDITSEFGAHQVQVSFEDPETNSFRREDFDLVILACAVTPSESVPRLSEILDAEIDIQSWYIPKSLKDMEDRHIYVCGCALSPMNIQESVANAWAVSGKAMEVLSSARGTLVTEPEYPPEIPVSPEDPPRIGVLVCRCGTNIGGYLDVPAVVEYCKTLPNVVVAVENMYSCSSDSQETIKRLIKENLLNRFIVASCTPRTHEELFRETLREAGVNPYLFELVNIRDQNSWVHMHEPERATEKACDLIRMHVAKVSVLQPQYRYQIEVTKKTLVLGGGVSGLEASLSIANQNIPVIVLEKSDQLGGVWNEISPAYDGSFSREDVQELIKRVMKHPLITVKTNSILTNLTGFVGNYQAKISTAGEEIQEKVGAIIVATGVIQAGLPTELSSLTPGKVMTQYDFEIALESDALKLPANPRVVFHQCYGQRGDPTVEKPFSGCSNICCEITLKQVNNLLGKYPEAKICVLHRGMQLAWKPSEEIAREARNKVMFQKFDPAKGIEYSTDNGDIHINYFDEEVGDAIEFNADLVVLATNFKPEDDTRKLGPVLKVPLTEDGFFLEAHVKLRPLDFATDGIFLGGSAKYPASAVFARMTGIGAAGRAVKMLSKGYVETEGITAEVDESRCIGCLSCVEVCPFGAIQVKDYKVNVATSRYPKILNIRKAYIVPASCKGCGTCVATCPKKAISQKHFRNNQIINMIHVFQREKCE